MRLLSIMEALGGLGLFVFGMKTMSDGFQRISSGAFRRLVEKMSGNRISAAATGCALSSLLQSSGAASVLIIGFVNAGLLTLYQAMAILVGTGFGTMIAVQFISFKISILSLPIIFLGVALRYFTSRRRLILVGQILLGVGLIFLGLEIMETRFSPLEGAAIFDRLHDGMLDWRLVSVLSGAALTLLVQSGSAAIGIAIALAISGAMAFEQAMAMALGEVLGTALLALISSIGGTISAKRTSALYCAMALAAVSLVVLFFPGFLDLVRLVFNMTLQPEGISAGSSFSPSLVGREIANGYALFTIMMAVVFLPSIGMFARVAGTMLAEKNGFADLAPRSRYLDFRIINTPYLAYMQSTNELKRMAHVAGSMVSDTVLQFHDFSDRTSTLIRQKENLLDVLQKDLSGFLVELGRYAASEEISSRIPGMLSSVNELEAIGDSCEIIIDCLERKKDAKVFFSDAAMSEIKFLGRDVIRLVTMAVNSLEHPESFHELDAAAFRDTIAGTAHALRENHLQRLSSGACTVIAGLLYMDIVETFARIGDISFSLMSGKKETW